MQYKCVPAPSELEIEGKKSYEDAIRSFADLINKEANGGWNFHSMENIAVLKKPGCLAALFGKGEETVHYNMLVFSREHDESATSESEKPTALGQNKTTPTNYIVVGDVNLQSSPDSNASIIKTLPDGTFLTLLEKGESVIIAGIEAPWVKVKTEKNEIGWCFSGWSYSGRLKGV